MSSIWNKIVNNQTHAGLTDTQHYQKDNINNRYENYMSAYDSTLSQKFDAEKDEKFVKERQSKAQSVVNAYYDIATDFYEYGWGQSFHFATRFIGEAFESSIARHEYYLASRIGIKKGQKILDVGCGVGGPLRNIARFTQAHVTGLNNNLYQCKRALRLNLQAGLGHLSNIVSGDFMNMPFEANSFDNIYAIEATCHAPDRTGCYKQIFNTLKEGGIFGGYEWTMTDHYDTNNELHRRLKHGIEEGNAIPQLTHYNDILQRLKAAGFEIIEYSDLAQVAEENGNSVGWYTSFEGGCTLDKIKHTRFGRKFTQLMVDVLEAIRVAPKGTSGTHAMLTKTADAIALSGKLQLFTPMFFFLARKPAPKQ